MRKPWRITATLLFIAALLSGAMVGDHLLALSDETRDNLRLYTELVTVAHESYGAEIEFQDLVFASIHGMLRTLDPHTSFLSPRAYTGMRERQQKTFYGLGILVSMRNGQLTVRTPIEGSPASRLGIRAGDVISAIEGEPTDDMTLDEAVDKLKGPKGTQVNIQILRRGLPEPLHLTVTRAEIPQTTVRQKHLLDERTGYIQLTDFNRASAEEMADAIAELKERGMQRLLLDLRNNGGGLLDQAIEIADQFVPADSVIVETRGRGEDTVQTFEAAGTYPKLDMPVVVMVNNGTASAAEIVSGAIQDHDVGLIVGTPTWGKGLVQTVYNLSYGAGLALTTAKYYTPSGRLIQRDYSHYYDYVITDEEAAEIVPDSVPPGAEVFHTDLGRVVYGGGGITPDVIVDLDELTTFEQFLLARDAFLNFAVDLRQELTIDSPDWRPPQKLLARFKRWIEQEGIASADEVAEGLADEESGRFVLRMIGAEVLNDRFGQEAQHRLLAEGDKQIQTALSLFDDATDLLARRSEVDLEPRGR